MSESSNQKQSVNPAPVGKKADDSLDISAVLSVVWGLRWWTVLIVAICMICAFCYIKVTRVKYTAHASIMLVNRDNIGSAEVSILNDITGMSKTNKAINEIEILKSQGLMQRVVETLGLSYTYQKNRKIKPIIYDLGSSPILCVFDGIDNNPNPTSCTVTIIPVDSVSYSIHNVMVSGSEYPLEGKVYRFGEQVQLFNHFFSIEKTGVSSLEIGAEYLIKMSPSYQVARSMTGRLVVNTDAKKDFSRTDIISFSYTDIFPKRTEVVLNTLIDEYNKDSREFRNKANANAIAFLDERLATISNELGSIEGDYQSYRKSNVLVDVAAQSSISLSSGEKYESKLNEVMLQLQLLGIITEQISKMGESPAVLPSNIGISDQGLSSSIVSYNTLVMERNRMAANSSDSNPLVQQADSQISEYLSSIRASVRSLERSYKVQINSLKSNLRSSRKRMTDIPEQQLALSSFERQQKIKEPLFMLLQQKREEAMIALSSVTDQCKIVNSADHTATATSPDTKKIYIIAFLLGFCIAPGIFYLRQFLRVTIDGKVDVTSRCSLPVLASIPLADKPDQLVRMSGREPYEEAFRVLRSNFRYSPHRIYQVVSSSQGEGKTFISSNIAISLAHAGKHVLLVGLDLRKPRLAQLFGIDKHVHGSVSYLIGHTDDVRSLISKDVAEIKGLDVIFPGSIPPNPSELLESDRMATFAETIRNFTEYDYILYDSCPFLLVADSVVVNNYVDANLFVMRTGVCPLRFVEELDGIAETKLKNVSVVINGVDLRSRSYGYYNGYGYGRYGYGRYGYGRYGYGRYGYGHKHPYGYGYGYGYGNAPEQTEEDKETGKDKKTDKVKKTEKEAK